MIAHARIKSRGVFHRVAPCGYRLFAEYEKEQDFEDAESVDCKEGDEPPFYAEARGAPQRHAFPDKGPYEQEYKKGRARDAECGEGRVPVCGEVLEI